MNGRKSFLDPRIRDADGRHDQLGVGTPDNGKFALSVHGQNVPELGAVLPFYATACNIQPSIPYLLETGWSADNVRGADAAREELAEIVADPAAFVERLDDPQAKSGPVTLPDGSTVPRLPGFRRWLWDGAFCGNIGFRWRRGTTALPDYCLGHIGYAVVPWKRGRGYATRGLALLLDEIRREVRDPGLTHLEVTAKPDNAASLAVIRANGGRLIERFVEPAAYGARPALRFHIDL